MSVSDGQGFPDGLQGRDIPLGARLLAVANDYDSLQIGTFSALRFTPEEAREALKGPRRAMTPKCSMPWSS